MSPDTSDAPEAISGSSRIALAGREVLESRSGKGRAKHLLLFTAPAFIASVAHMDPGNCATNVRGGAQFGYSLLWVVFASNLMAMLVQSLSAKLGIATGHNLAELCRLHCPPFGTWIMWGLTEIVAMATDLAEFLGAASGFNLLFGIPLWVAALVTFLMLGLERYGFRPLEVVISGMVAVVALCYLAETAAASGVARVAIDPKRYRSDLEKRNQRRLIEA
jgi:manganese transport protein